jgi:putative sigma-54 modulation protein
MNIIIKSVDFNASLKLESFIRQKLSKLFRQSDKVIRASIVLHKDGSGYRDNKVCDIRLMVPGNDHFASRSSEVYEKSILLAVETLQKILRRQKSKLLAERY